MRTRAFADSASNSHRRNLSLRIHFSVIIARFRFLSSLFRIHILKPPYFETKISIRLQRPPPPVSMIRPSAFTRTIKTTTTETSAGWQSSEKKERRDGPRYGEGYGSGVIGEYGRSTVGSW